MTWDEDAKTIREWAKGVGVPVGSLVAELIAWADYFHDDDYPPDVAQRDIKWWTA